mmetsp:Transcript_44445/g.172615  ORF Transcript_44445/g.172615 Transcript_44445/m.172615 type:complete len:94 (-) Transcript_44445:219-500(-)
MGSVSVKANLSDEKVPQSGSSLDADIPSERIMKKRYGTSFRPIRRKPYDDIRGSRLGELGTCSYLPLSLSRSIPIWRMLKLSSSIRQKVLRRE